jgi:hypothetical protein
MSAVCGLVLVAGATAARVMPAFSWATLPVAWHSGNSTGRYTDAQIRELARYQMVTLEKFQGLNDVVPAQTLARPYEAPGGLYACAAVRGGSSGASGLRRCGCCAEDEIVRVARKIKAINPRVLTVAYLNAQISYPWYRAAREVAAHPSWWLNGSRQIGPSGSTWCARAMTTPADSLWRGARQTGHMHTEWLPIVRRKVYDLTVESAANSWKDACLNLTRTGALDSCFVDGCVSQPKGLPPAKQARFAAAKASMIAQLQERVPGPLVCGSAGLGTAGAGAIQVRCGPEASDFQPGRPADSLRRR